jgi:hypothetical protein
LYPTLIRGSYLGTFVPYPPPTSRSSENDILFYLHSSGSTGFPKPIPMTNLSTIHWCLTRKSPKHLQQTVLRQSAISMHSRPHRRSNSYPHLRCILATIPCSGCNCSAAHAHRIPRHRVHILAHIFPRPLGGPYNSHLTKYPRLCTKDEIKCFVGRARLPRAMGIFSQCC